MSKQMIRVSPSGRGGYFNNIHEYEETLESPGNGEWILVPAGITSINCTLYFSGGGSGKIQTTSSSIEKVNANNAVAVDWPHGEVSDTTQDTTSPVTAIRQVCVGATSILALRAQ